MKMIFKSTLAAALLAGAAAAVPTSAIAGVDISVNLGPPAVVVGPPPVAVGPPPVVVAPEYVPYDAEFYYDPIYIDGAWYHGPYRWRMVDGVRVFWVDGGWRRNEWHGAIPGSLMFRNGGYWRGGRYEGFRDAERINARFVAARHMEHAEHAERRAEHDEMKFDREEMKRRDQH